MKPLLKFKIALDVLMAIGLLLSMSYILIGLKFHEYNGAIMLFLFIVHNALNRRWYKSIFRGPYLGQRLVQTSINLLTLTMALILLVSGIILSQEVFGFINISGFTSLARTLHLIAAYWGFALISMHVGMHWGWILSMLKGLVKMSPKPKEKPAYFSYLTWGGRFIGLLIALLGLKAFVKHNLISYMTLQTQFVFIDLEQPLMLFFADYIAMIVMWAYFAAILRLIVSQLFKTGSQTKWATRKNHRQTMDNRRG